MAVMARRRHTTELLVVLAALSLTSPARAEPEPAPANAPASPTATAPAATPAEEKPSKELLEATRTAVTKANLTPRDAGSRYGQALGAAEVCTGIKATERALTLSALYEKEDLETFKAQEKKIYDAWIRVKHCIREDDPNHCTLIIEESCAAAVTEIGPAGSAMPGLIEPPPK